MQTRSKTLAKEYLEKLIDGNSASFSIEGKTFTRRELIIKAIQLDPRLARLYNVLGVYLQDKNETIEIPYVGIFNSPRQAFLKSIELNPQLGRAYSNLARCLNVNESIYINTMGMVTKKELHLKSIQEEPMYGFAYIKLAEILDKNEIIVIQGIGKLSRKELVLHYLKHPNVSDPDSLAYEILAESLAENEVIDIPRLGQVNKADLIRAGKANWIYLVKGRDKGKDAWYYILVEKNKESDFLKALNDDIIHLENYGKILDSGYGDEPPEEVTKRIKKEYYISTSIPSMASGPKNNTMDSEEKPAPDLKKYKAEDLFNAARWGNLVTVKEILKAQPDLQRAADQNNDNALHWASWNSQLAVVKYLVEECRFPLDPPGYMKRTALMQAAKRGDLDLVRYLVEQGATIDPKDQDGNDAIQLAESSEKTLVVDFLKRSLILVVSSQRK